MPCGIVDASLALMCFATAEVAYCVGPPIEIPPVTMPTILLFMSAGWRRSFRAKTRAPDGGQAQAAGWGAVCE